MKKLAKIVRIVAIIAFILGCSCFIIHFLNREFNLIGLLTLIIMIFVMIIGGILEGKIGEKRCYQLMRFNIINILVYCVLIVYGFSCFSSGDIFMGFISAGTINCFKLLELSDMYLKKIDCDFIELLGNSGIINQDKDR